MNTYGVVGLEPIADEEGVVGGGRGEGDGDEGAAEDADAAEAARGLVECEGREVVIRADLVLHLQHVSEVPPRRDRARRPVHAVLERVPPLLYPVPAKCVADREFSIKNLTNMLFYDVKIIMFP